MVFIEHESAAAGHLAWFIRTMRRLGCLLARVVTSPSLSLKLVIRRGGVGSVG